MKRRLRSPPQPDWSRWSRRRPPAVGGCRALAGIWVPAAMLIVIFFLCFVWPLIVPVPSPTDGNILYSNLPSFSPGHLLGTDAPARTVVSPALRRAGVAGYSARRQRDRPDLRRGIEAVAGVCGWRDSVVMRMLDVVIAFPALVLALAIAEDSGPASSTPSSRSASSACRRSPGSPVPPRCACGSKTTSWRPVCRAPLAANPDRPHHAQHPSPADHVRLAGHGHHDHPRGRAELPRAWNPAARAELGQHDRPGPGDPFGGAQYVLLAERGAVHHRCRLQPARRQPADALERR